MENRFFFTNTQLKIIALVSMIFDHLGKALLYFFPSDTTATIEFYFSLIGRFAFPIFLFLIIEGFYHTKSIKKYFLRLSVLFSITGIALLIIALIPNLNLSPTMLKTGNIFVDLILSLLFLLLINNDKPLVKALAIFPISYFIVFLLIQNGTIITQNNILKAVLAMIAPQYSFYTPCILILFSLITICFNFGKSLKKYADSFTFTNGFYLENYKTRKYVYSISITIMAFVFHFLTYLSSTNLNTNLVVMTYTLLAIIPILLYNGAIGKSNEIIKKAFYLSYPVSLFIIFLLVYIFTLF